jgi:putative endonuclease
MRSATCYFFYILTNRTRTLYIGVTNDLQRRVYEDRSGEIPGFTSRYKIHRLVYFEQFVDIRQAIAREKEIKRWLLAERFNWLKALIPTGRISVWNGCRTNDNSSRISEKSLRVDPSLRSG